MTFVAAQVSTTTRVDIAVGAENAKRLQVNIQVSVGVFGEEHKANVNMDRVYGARRWGSSYSKDRAIVIITFLRLEWLGSCWS